jgi:hypothetical protein
MIRARLSLAGYALIALLSLVTPAGAQQPSLEYDVKAAFVLNFVRYVEWPPTHRSAPLRLCVLQGNPFGTRLESVVSGEQWQGGPIEVRVVADVRRDSECHLLYVPQAVQARFVASQSAIAGQPVLTVGEDAAFLDRGGMIRLFVEEKRVRFSINQKAAEAAGLLISSRLLRLARVVIGTTGVE